MARTKKEIRYVQILILLVASLAYFGTKSFITYSPRLSLASEETAYVERAVDGDTLKLSNRERVRLIGIDTPELHYSEKLLRDSRRTNKDIQAIQELGERAAAFTKKLCEGKKVRLEFDVQKRDKYKRLLAYVYLEDGTFVNAKILEEGYGQVMTIPPDVKYAEYFLKLEKEARDKHKGLWSSTDTL